MRYIEMFVCSTQFSPDPVATARGSDTSRPQRTLALHREMLFSTDSAVGESGPDLNPNHSAAARAAVLASAHSGSVRPVSSRSAAVSKKWTPERN